MGTKAREYNDKKGYRKCLNKLGMSYTSDEDGTAKEVVQVLRRTGGE